MRSFLRHHRLKLDLHTEDVLRRSSLALILRIAGAGLSFGISVWLARQLGPDRAGVYFLGLSVVTIAAVLGRVGLDNSVLRFSAASAVSGDWVAVKGLLAKSMLVTSVASAVMTAVVVILAPWLGTAVFNADSLSNPLRIMAAAIIPTCLFTVVAQLFLGLKHTSEGIALLSVWSQGLCLLGVAFLTPHFGVSGAATAYATAAVLTAGLGWWRYRMLTPQLKGIAGQFPSAQLFQSSFPLFWVALSQLATSLSATVILGILSTTADVGIYSAASRVAVLIGFFVQAVSSIASPKFAAMHQQNDMHALESLARNSTRLLILATGPVFLVIFSIPDTVMGIFGPEFAAGAQVISILAMGQLINILTGPVGSILMMTGNEKTVRNAMFISASVCVALTLLLIPAFGALGAAIAGAVTVSLENLLMAVLVWQKYRIVATPIRWPAPKR